MAMRASATTPFAHALQQFLRLEDAHVQQLADVESDLAKKLRFHCTASAPSSRSAPSLSHHVHISRFTDALAHLHHLHRVFGAQVSALAAAGCNDVDMEASIVDALDEMLQVVRFQYGQLFCRAEATQAAFEGALSAGASGSSDALSVLQRFLAHTKLSVSELVARPQQRFLAIVAFIDELAPLCQDTALAPRLQQLAVDTRHYIHTVQAEARDERELIALQSQIEPTSAVPSLDLSTEKLLLHSDVRVTTLRATGEALDVTRAEKLYAHCFQSGRLMYSTAADDRYVVRDALALKHDAVFVESVPDAVLPTGASNGALALISSRESVVLVFDDAVVAQHWSETIASLLAQNETRAQVLRSERSFDAIAIPSNVAKKLKVNKRRSSLVPFPSFPDDDLPGLFWLERDTPAGAAWELVELMFYDHWLLVSSVVGWKHHALLHHVDCHDPTLTIREAPSRGSDWGLVLSSAASALELKLVSKRRARIDFWFDQISKAVAKAAHDAVALPAVARGASDDAKKPTKKRKSSEQTASAANAATTDTEDAGGKAASAQKIDALVDAPHETFEGGDAGDDALPTSASKAKKSRKEPVKRPDIVSKMQSPAIKTPKRRWLKLKEEDPDDSILLDTDISQDTVESTTRESRTSQSQNALTSTIRIILTGMELTPAVRKKIKAIGSAAVYEDDIELATHVIAPKNQLKRTVKLLCGISRCEHILDEKWLDDSARAGAPLSEQDYCLLDTVAQSKWHFDLHKTMYEFTPAQRRQLFVGHTVFITNHKSVLPPVKDLVKIVECAGGKAEVRGSAGPSDLVITSDAALSVASVQKALANANPQRIYSPELILSSILQQHIAFDKNHLELPASKKRR